MATVHAHNPHNLERKCVPWGMTLRMHWQGYGRGSVAMSLLPALGQPSHSSALCRPRHGRGYACFGGPHAARMMQPIRWGNARAAFAEVAWLRNPCVRKLYTLRPINKHQNTFHEAWCVKQ